MKVDALNVYSFLSTKEIEQNVLVVTFYLYFDFFFNFKVGCHEIEYHYLILITLYNSAVLRFFYY